MSIVIQKNLSIFDVNILVSESLNLKLCIDVQ